MNKEITKILESAQKRELLILNLAFLKVCNKICEQSLFYDYLYDLKNKDELYIIQSKFPEKESIEILITKLIGHLQFIEKGRFYPKIWNILNSPLYEDFFSTQKVLFKSAGVAEEELEVYISCFILAVGIIFTGLIEGIGNSKLLNLALHTD